MTDYIWNPELYCVIYKQNMDNKMHVMGNSYFPTLSFGEN